MNARETLVARDVQVTYRTRTDRSAPLIDRIRRFGPKIEEVHAVRGVSLTLHEGESIGVIGSNGSGKTTLVSALSGLLDLTGGEVLAVSRPALLGVGAALNRQLSGRRNIVLGLLSLGLSRAEIRDRMSAIVQFSGLGDAIDRPMRTYSSGMKARLAFTVATEVTPEILIIDEALAVGDRRFRGRAVQRIEEIRSGAGSIIVISHNLAEVAAMCTRVIWLDAGEIVADGDAEEVIDMYLAANPLPPSAAKKLERRTQRRRKLHAEARAAVAADE